MEKCGEKRVITTRNELEERVKYEKRKEGIKKEKVCEITLRKRGVILFQSG